MDSATLNSTSAAGAGVSSNRTIWLCERFSRFERSRGIFYGDNPLTHTMPVLILQSSFVGLLTACLQHLLIPIGESSFFPQMLAGLTMGPSGIGQSQLVSDLIFPPRTFYVSETIAFFGSMMFLFLIGVKIDLSAVMRTGKKTLAIGVGSFFIPTILSTIVALGLRSLLLTPEQKLYSALLYLSFFLSSCSFHVTASHLADLKLLNSEMGRLAVSSAMVSGTVSAFVVTSLLSHHVRLERAKKDNYSYNVQLLCFIFMVIFVACVFRPIMLWMIRKTPEGQPIKESYIISIFLMLLACSLFSELIGEHFMVGPIILGIAVPDGPPLGSALIDKLEMMVNAIFLPLYFLFSGAKFKISLIDSRSFLVVQVLAVASFLGKVMGAMLPAICCKVPKIDALSLGLLMSAQGITQLLFLQGSLFFHIIDDQSYGNVVIAMLWLTGATTPLVKFLYDPSKSYSSLNTRRTIEHAPPNVELRLMACLHCEESTPSIINLLEMSNPTEDNPICFYVLHMIQLSGRSIPLFIDHQHKANSLYSNNSQHIINAFRSYEQQNTGKVVVNLFTSISPYETMHDELSMQAVEKRASMLIVPFHRQWRSSGMTESAHPIRALNLHLLRTAPCSIGILVERGTLSNNHPLTCVSFYSVGVLFIEGSDDREALVYAMRMVDHPNVRVTVVRLMEPHRKSRNLMSRDPDGDLIHRFKVDCIQIKRHDYKEEVVRDSVEMISVIRTLDGCFDLVLVGRQHAADSALFSGLTEWNEYPELGALGDMLVSEDSTYDGSVLVVQQQRLAVAPHDLHLDGSSVNTTPLTIVQVPRDTSRFGHQF